MAKKILVVDDDPGMLDLCKFALEGVGYEVIPALSGDSALELYLAESAEIGMVLMDYSMPELNGVETAIKLRAEFPEVNICSFTGTKNEDVITLLEEMKMTPILTKPFGLSELVQLIEDQIGKPEPTTS